MCKKKKKKKLLSKYFRQPNSTEKSFLGKCVFFFYCKLVYCKLLFTIIIYKQQQQQNKTKPKTLLSKYFHQIIDLRKFFLAYV